MFEIDPILITYSEIFTYAFFAFLVSLLATPLVGKLANYIGAMDLPAKMRKAGEDSNTRINSKVTARLGGLSIVIAMGSILLLSERFGFSGLSAAMDFNSWGIWAGILVLTIAGIYDDARDLNPSAQLITQVVAALLVVASGVNLDSVPIGNEFIASLGPVVGQFIIVVWIVAMINFVNWASGIDALHGGLTSVASLTLLLLAMGNGNPFLATLIAIHLGANLGVLPFNYYPSKIFYGFGESINGFLLAVFAISGEVKFATSLVILGLPLVDALWVAMNRVRRKAKETRSFKELLAAPMKGDKTHLHHRLLELGYSWKTVVLIELLIMSVFSIAAFFYSGFSLESLTVQLALTAVGLIVIFIVINIARTKVKQQRIEAQIRGEITPTVQVKLAVKHENADENENLEEKYIY